MKLSHFMTLLLLGAIWGASYPLMRVSVPEWGVLTLTSLRTLIASVLLIVFLKYKKLKLDWNQNSRHYLFIGFFNFTLPLALFSFAAGKIPAAYSAIINATVPFWTLLIAYFIFQESLTLKMFLGVIIGITGVALVNGAGTIELSLSPVLGMLAATVAAMFYAVSSSYIRKNASHVSPVLLTAGSTFVASAVLLPFGVFYAPNTIPSYKAMVAVFALAAFCTVTAFIIFYDLVKKIGMTNAVLVTFLIPVFGAIWGFLFLNESVNLGMITGMAFIMLGLALIIYGKAKK